MASTEAFLAIHELVATTISEIPSTFGEGRQGGYFYCRNPAGLIMHVPVGTIGTEKMARYQMFSREKVKRLQEHPRHWLSAESRNEAAEQFAGAARGTRGEIFSFSGLPESIDEAAVLAWLVGMDYLRYDEAVVRLERSPVANPEAFSEIHQIVMWAVSGGRLMQ